MRRGMPDNTSPPPRRQSVAADRIHPGRPRAAAQAVRAVSGKMVCGAMEGCKPRCADSELRRWRERRGNVTKIRHVNREPQTTDLSLLSRGCEAAVNPSQQFLEDCNCCPAAACDKFSGICPHKENSSCHDVTFWQNAVCCSVRTASTEGLDAREEAGQASRRKRMV